MPKSHLYRLKFSEHRPPAPDIEFEAPDPFQAFALAHKKAHFQPVELWKDGRKLCSIERKGGELWEINPHTALASKTPG